jgi:hypothetical protein
MAALFPTRVKNPLGLYTAQQFSGRTVDPPQSEQHPDGKVSPKISQLSGLLLYQERSLVACQRVRRRKYPSLWGNSLRGLSTGNGFASNQHGTRGIPNPTLAKTSRMNNTTHHITFTSTLTMTLTFFNIFKIFFQTFLNIFSNIFKYF